MTQQNILAIAALMSLLVTLYAIRAGHARYLPDMALLALALLAPRQWLALGAAGLVIMVRHTGLARGLAGDLPGWTHALLLPGACDMSSAAPASAGQLAPAETAISDTEYTDQSAEISQPVAENARELIELGETAAIARLIVAGHINLTEGVKVGAGAKSGSKYQRRSRQVKAEVERIQNHYTAPHHQQRFG